VDRTTLTFTASDWNQPQTVTVTGLDDDIDDGDEQTTITISVNAAASDSAFQLVAEKTVSVTTTDDDITPPMTGDIDGDGDFDANDSFLIHLVKLSGTNSQIDLSKGGSTLTSVQIRAIMSQLSTPGDVDGDQDFDANDSFLIHLVKLSGTDLQIDQSKGGSSLTAATIRASVNGLGAASSQSVAEQELAVSQSAQAPAPKTDDARSISTNPPNSLVATVGLPQRNLFLNAIADDQPVSVVPIDVNRAESGSDFVWEEFRQWIDAI